MSLQAMTSVLSELTSEAVDAAWRTPVAIRHVLARVAQEAPRHIVLLPDSRADEAFDLAADGVDFVDGDATELRFLREQVGGVPVIFAPEELRMMVTRSGPLLHVRLRSRPPIGRSQGGLLEELFEEVRDEESEPGGPHAYRLLGGNLVVVPQGFMVGGRLIVLRRAVQRLQPDDRASYLLGRVVASAWSPITQPVSGAPSCVRYARL